MSTVHDTDHLACADAEALLPLVADGTLDAEADAPLFAHLAGCARCQESLARHDLISLALAQPSFVAPPRARLSLVPRAAWLPLAAAAAVLIAFGGWWSLRDDGRAAAVIAAESDEPVIEREVIRIEQPGGIPAYLVLEGDRRTLVTSDVSEADNRPARPQPVVLQRY